MRKVETKSRSAKRIRHGRRRKRWLYWALQLVGLCYLLFFPLRAVVEVANRTGVGYVVSYLTIVSATTAYLYWSDKRRAQRDEWRIPEAHLHLMDLVGGWPAAYLAQRVFRHKIAKREFQFTFWLIVIVHQYVAVDFMQAWKWTHYVHGALEQFRSS
ncbi:MAG: DUF1294 domain-containing protein [Lentisphaerae bacterium]|nr:DUF1294 domain-containing protein [Lentisphaerota bacterium]